MTQRRRLDHFLLRKAAEAGAEVREGETADARELDATIVIGADGCNGASAKQLELADGVLHGVALEANYPYDARYASAMVLEIAVIRGGYGWIFPKGDHVNVGVGGNGGGGAAAATRATADVRGVRRRPGRGTGHARLPLAAAAAGDAARPRPDCGDRRRGRARRPVLRRRDCTRRSSPHSSYPRQLSKCSWAAPTTSTPTRPRSNGESRRSRGQAGEPSAPSSASRGRRTHSRRLPVTFRALEKLLQGDLPEPSAARGIERVAIRAIYARLASSPSSPGYRSAASS